MEIEINTKIGKFFFKRTKGEKYCGKLLDNDKNYILRVYDEEILKRLEHITHINQLVDIEYCNNICWAESEEEVVEIAMETNETASKEDLLDFVNRVGKTYFIVDFSEI